MDVVVLASDRKVSIKGKSVLIERPCHVSEHIISMCVFLQYVTHCCRLLLCVHR